MERNISYPQYLTYQNMPSFHILDQLYTHSYNWSTSNVAFDWKIVL